MCFRIGTYLNRRINLVVYEKVQLLEGILKYLSLRAWLLLLES